MVTAGKLSPRNLNSNSLSHPISTLPLVPSLQSVYACHLLRKDKLLKVFQGLQLYKPDVRLPAEVRLTVPLLIISHSLLIS